MSALDRRQAAPGPNEPMTGIAGRGGELCYVIAGAGRLDIKGYQSITLRPDRGLWLPPDVGYVLCSEGDGLRLDMVQLPAAAPAGPADPLVRDLAECPVETTGDRQFRVLFGPGRDCRTATQFVGEIPPGRAPEHSHPYDEVVLVLSGTGLLHAGGDLRPIGPGSTAHLPPALPHCLENTGTQTLRVLGVFHPADSPAAKLGH
jgi:quercetin dioxygenase-like cupin family protein